jgi:hypothetical protein
VIARIVGEAALLSIRRRRRHQEDSQRGERERAACTPHRSARRVCLLCNTRGLQHGAASGPPSALETAKQRNSETALASSKVGLSATFAVK